MPRGNAVPLSAKEWADLLLELPPDTLRAELASYNDDKGPKYPEDPVDFAREVLKLEPWETQAKIAETLMQNRSTVVFSGHSVGKSFISAALACWFLSTKRPAIVVTLAPTFVQVNQLLWRYIRMFARRANLPGVVFDSPNWKISPEVFGMGLSPRKAAKDTQGAQELAATIQGYHSENMLVILDEAAGLPRMVFDAAKSLVTGEHDHLLAIGNPIAQNGPFWDAMQNPAWGHIHISCLDHPNIKQGKNVIAGAVSRAWVEEQALECPRVPPETPNAICLPWILERYFLPSNIFMSKVLGYAPEEAEDQLIPLSWVIGAQSRYYTSEIEPGDIILGLDPARHGSADSTICARYGGQVLFVRRHHGQDTIQLANWLQSVMVETNALRAYIDTIGIGSGVYDIAKKTLGLPVFESDFRKRAFQSTRFANLRAECWWRVREALQREYLALPPDDAMLSGDLTAVKFGYDPNGRVLLEDKDEVGKRIGRSPDAADALALTFTQPTSFTDMHEAMLANTEEFVVPNRWTREVPSAGPVVVNPTRTVSRWNKRGRW